MVSFDNLSEFKDHNKGIMLALLQSIYLKEYFNALEGIRIKNSLPFLNTLIKGEKKKPKRILRVATIQIKTLRILKITEQSKPEMIMSIWISIAK